MRATCLICALALVPVLASSAVAETTDVYPVYYADELGHEEILEAIYLADFTSDGDDFISLGLAEAIVAIRFDDDLPVFGVLDPVHGQRGDTADRLWGDAWIAATATARYASYTQQFGYDVGDGYEPLFDVEGYGTEVTGSGTADLTGQTWTWVRRDTDGSNPWYSDDARNSDELDHMVTYRIDGLDTAETVWLVFWEDLPGAYGPPCASDRDFNDLVVEIRAIPEPATLALLTAGTLTLLRRRRPKR